MFEKPKNNKGGRPPKEVKRLRTLSVKFRVKTLNREVLQLTGTLNHIAANLNQIAKKRNSFDELSVLERARLNQQSTSLQQIVTDIKAYLQ
jgi:methyl-accepting chemotaxis protein